MPRRPKPLPLTSKLTVTPNPIPLGTSRVTIDGYGFSGYTTVYILAADLATHPVTTDSFGRFSFEYIHDWDIPTVRTIEAWDSPGMTNRKLASVSVTVE